MTNTQIIDVELSRPGWQANIFAVAGDMYSRYIEVHLYNGGQPYEPPSGTTCMIGWWRNDTEFGSYNSVMTEDGSTRQAWSIDGNVVTIELNWQIAQKAGKVGVNVALIGTDGSRISTWEMLCDVQRGPVAEADDPTLPSESATEAADRAEKAAKDAEAALGQVDDKIDAAVQGVTDEATQAAKDAAASAGKVDEALKELDGMLEDGPVVSVNGKTGRVTLTAADVKALGLPAAPKAGQLLVIEAVGEDGSITVGTADSAPGGDTAVQSVNGKKPDGTGNVTIPTGVMTINSQKPDGEGNFDISTVEPRVTYSSTPPYSIQLQPNTLYYLGNRSVQMLTVTLAAQPDAKRVAEYHFIFRSGSTPTVLNLPESVIKPEDFAVEANKIYEVSICENLMLVQSWGVA